MPEYSPVKKLGIFKILNEFHDPPRLALESLLKDLYQHPRKLNL
jgi:hypothetical protein